MLQHRGWWMAFLNGLIWAVCFLPVCWEYQVFSLPVHNYLAGWADWFAPELIHTHHTPSHVYTCANANELVCEEQENSVPSLSLKMALAQHLINAFSLANRKVWGNWVRTVTTEIQGHMILSFAVREERYHTVQVSRHKTNFNCLGNEDLKYTNLSLYSVLVQMFF